MDRGEPDSGNGSPAIIFGLVTTLLLDPDCSSSRFFPRKVTRVCWIAIVYLVNDLRHPGAVGLKLIAGTPGEPTPRDEARINDYEPLTATEPLLPDEELPPSQSKSDREGST